MHKIIICRAGILALLLSVILAKIIELEDLHDQKEALKIQLAEVRNFSREIRYIPYLKSKDRIFVKNYDLKTEVGKISKKLNIQKILIKHLSDCEEIRIKTASEKMIYTFLEELFFDLPGFVQFTNLNICPTEKNWLIATIQLRIIPCDLESLITIPPSAAHLRPNSFITLFGWTQRHKLFGIVNNSKAYIDNAWLSIGDPVDNYRISSIGSHTITIQDDTGKTTTVKLGHTW
ncbi:MAG: hypothetical protein LBS14_00280 [Holosporaceae bacterium]|nr:hypothetical protein [Holosporaceae bacterium]